MIYLGIDPGRRGGVVALSEDGRTVLLAERCPLFLDRVDVRAMAEIGDRIRALGSATLTIEKPIAKQRNGKTDSGYKALLTSRRDWLTALRMKPTFEPVPVTWQKIIATCQGTDTKAKAIHWCRCFLPALDLRPGKCVAEHDGLADAAVLAEFGRRVARLTPPPSSSSVPHPARPP